MFLVLPLSGCTEAQSDARDEDERSATAGIPDDVVLDATGCREAGVLFFVDPQQAARHLPSGYVPADAQGLFGLPVASGRAAILVVLYHCEDAAIEGEALSAGEIDILIDAPDVPGADDDADNHFYQTIAHAMPGELAVLLTLADWPVVKGEQSLGIRANPAGLTTAHGTARDRTQVDHAFKVDAAVESRITGTNRFWHQNAYGVGHIDYTVDTTALAGIAECSLREDSPAALVTGVTDCADAQTAGLVVPDVEWTGRFRWFPDVQAS